ncbi:MAG: ABC transporter permease [Acidimicrobiales bacterium]
MRAEWTKIRTVRSTTWSILAMVIVSVGISAIASAAKASQFTRHSSMAGFGFDPTRISLTGLLLGQLAIGVLGVLVITAEYSTGTINATFAATPRRYLVLLAKIAVFGMVAFVVSEITAFASFFVGQAILSGSAPYATLSTPGTLRAVVGGGLYLTALGLLALGLGAIIRHTAGAITIFVTMLLIFPLILQALPTSYIDAISRYLPANIGVVLISTASSTASSSQPFAVLQLFSPWAGLGVLCGYAALALIVGIALMVRRDV